MYKLHSFKSPDVVAKHFRIIAVVSPRAHAGPCMLTTISGLLKNYLYDAVGLSMYEFSNEYAFGMFFDMFTHANTILDQHSLPPYTHTYI